MVCGRLNVGGACALSGWLWSFLCRVWSWDGYWLYHYIKGLFQVEQGKAVLGL